MKLLIVEDEVIVRSLVVRHLATDGHEVTVASNAEDALSLIDCGRFDGYIFDVLLPGLSGRELCSILRARGEKAPILLLTALSELEDKVTGLDAGANDYMTKPFEMEELKARLRAMERVVLAYPKPVKKVGDLEINPNTQTAVRKGEPIALTPKEYALLDLLVENQGQTVTKETICRVVWGFDHVPLTNIVNVFVNSIRRKIDHDPDPPLIHTVRGQGFSLWLVNPDQPKTPPPPQRPSTRP